MLTKNELSNNFYAFSFLSRVWRFPARFDRSSGLFHIPNGGRRRRLIFRVVLLIFTAHALMVSGRTFQTWAISRDLPLEFLAYGVAISVAFPGYCCVGILADQTIDIQVKIWNELLTRANNKGRSSQLHKRTWQELFICYLPFLLYPVILTFPVIYSIRPNLPYTLYGNVPSAFQCTSVLAACCLVEVILLTFYITMTNYFVVFIMLFVMHMKEELQMLQDKLDRIGIHPDRVTTWVRFTQPVEFLEPRGQAKDVEAGVMMKIKDEVKIQPTMKIVCEQEGKVTNLTKAEVESESEMQIEDKGNQGVNQMAVEKVREECREASVISKEKRVVKREARRKLKRKKRWAKASVWPAKNEGKWATKREQGSPVIIEMERAKKPEIISEAEELKNICSTMEHLNLFFRLFNLAFADTIFIAKIMAIAVVISCAFAFVRLAKSHPDLASIYGIIAGNTVCNSIGMFNNAFHLTGQAEKCKAMILIKSSTLLKSNQISKEEWQEFRCRVAAIPRLAVFCGPFHKLERDSTLNFIHFILQKLADLLLAF